MNTPITMIGTIGTVPERRTTTNGASVCRFRIACSERRYDREQNVWIDGDPSWVTFIAYRGLADHAHGSFNKGDRIIVNGRLKVRPWQNDEGKSGLAVEIEADACGHDLRWGVSKFTRTPSTSAAEGASDAPHEPDATAGGDGEERTGSAEPAGSAEDQGELVGAGAGAGAIQTPF